MPGAYSEDWDEQSVLNRFTVEALLLRPPESRPATDWEWYFAAQHYGVPARLLDWTEDPLVALHFALRGDLKDTDPPQTWSDTDPPATWILEPGSWNLGCYGSDVVYLPGENTRSEWWLPQHCGRERKAELETGSVQYNDHPIAIHPAWTTRRIQAQAGKFTVHGSEVAAMEESWCTRPDGDRHAHLQKLLLARPDQLLSGLRTMGYGRWRLFPEPATLADKLRVLYRP